MTLFLQLLKESSETNKQEDLPSIDDERNQLEVPEYINEIYEYYWATEVRCISLIFPFPYHHTLYYLKL